MDDKYRGTTVNERLYIGGFIDNFYKVVDEKDVALVIAILKEVELTEASIDPILKQLHLHWGVKISFKIPKNTQGKVIPVILVILVILYDFHNWPRKTWWKIPNNTQGFWKTIAKMAMIRPKAVNTGSPETKTRAFNTEEYPRKGYPAFITKKLTWKKLQWTVWFLRMKLRNLYLYSPD